MKSTGKQLILTGLDDNEKVDFPTIKVAPTGDLLTDIEEYCDLFQIPIEHFIKLLSDQKVVPMIRGKAIEFASYDYLLNILDNEIWEVTKLNLNAQPNSPDEDIAIKHIETNELIKIEVKSAVRNSFYLGTGRTKIKVPHYSVKCHRSRSNFINELNDRYLVTDFDLLINSPSNSLIINGEEFLIINNAASLKFLSQYYQEIDPLSLFKKSCQDIRVVRPTDIKTTYKNREVIPRNPKVLYVNDPHWKNISEIEIMLFAILKDRGYN